MSLKDVDLIEVNEAFAAQILANEKVLKWIVLSLIFTGVP